MIADSSALSIRDTTTCRKLEWVCFSDAPLGVTSDPPSDLVSVGCSALA